MADDLEVESKGEELVYGDFFDPPDEEVKKKKKKRIKFEQNVEEKVGKSSGPGGEAAGGVNDITGGAAESGESEGEGEMGLGRGEEISLGGSEEPLEEEEGEPLEEEESERKERGKDKDDNLSQHQKKQLKVSCV